MSNEIFNFDGFIKVNNFGYADFESVLTSPIPKGPFPELSKIAVASQLALSKYNNDDIIKYFQAIDDADDYLFNDLTSKEICHITCLFCIDYCFNQLRIAYSWGKPFFSTCFIQAANAAITATERYYSAETDEKEKAIARYHEEKIKAAHISHEIKGTYKRKNEIINRHNELYGEFPFKNVSIDAASERISFDLDYKFTTVRTHVRALRKMKTQKS